MPKFGEIRFNSPKPVLRWIAFKCFAYRNTGIVFAAIFYVRAFHKTTLESKYNSIVQKHVISQNPLFYL